MSSRPLHVAIAALLAAPLVACTASTAPQLKVLGVERAHESNARVVLVQVVNHAQRPMQLERLEYSFAAAGAGAAPATGELDLDRTVDAGAAVVVQVPLDLGTTAIAPGQTLELDGKLSARENAIERSFPVHADVTP